MTPAEVAGLTDAELNKACAENVMGWHLEKDGTSDRGYSYFDKDGVMQDDLAYWKPATSIENAAACTDKKRSDGWHFVINLYRDRCVIMGYRSMHKSVKDFIVEHERRERAEAEASLIAKLKEKSKD
jgi:hypothetical protein